MTGFNYFPTREDLVFNRMESFEERLVAAVEQRDPGESAVASFGTDQLAHLFTAETGAGADDFVAWAAARALMAVHHGLVQRMRNAVLAGQRGERLTKDAVAQANRAMARLESGLADYPRTHGERWATGRCTRRRERAWNR